MGCCGGGFSRRSFAWQADQQAKLTPIGREFSQESPLEALKLRLARGEIIMGEYQQLRSVLLDDESAS